MALQVSQRPQTVQEWLELLTATPEIEIFKFDLLSVDASGRELKREKGQAQYLTEDLGNGISLEMVTIPDGKFMMGTKDEEIRGLIQKWLHLQKKFISDRFRRENPQHKVTIQSFLMSKDLITQAQWRRVAALPKVNWDLKDDPSKFKGDNRPVERVSWYDAVEFCDRLNRFVEGSFSKYTNNEYRLPSEAEWEYAARAGTTTPFHFGETITTELVNYDGSFTYASAPKGEFRGKTTEVGSFLPNGFGLYDMHGNVWEWCQDTWHDNYRRAPSDGSAWVDNNHELHVVRGGCWHCFPDYCRSAYRIDHFWKDGNDNIGFRVVCAAPRTI
jgi:formylglycine-generating enzyme required for sulfatase activity